MSNICDVGWVPNRISLASAPNSTYPRWDPFFSILRRGKRYSLPNTIQTLQLVKRSFLVKPSVISLVMIGHGTWEGIGCGSLKRLKSRQWFCCFCIFLSLHPLSKSGSNWRTWTHLGKQHLGFQLSGTNKLTWLQKKHHAKRSPNWHA